MEGSEGGLLASEPPVTPSQPSSGPVAAAGACDGHPARSQWRARAGLSPASLSTDPFQLSRGSITQPTVTGLPDADAVASMCASAVRGNPV